MNIKILQDQSALILRLRAHFDLTRSREHHRSITKTNGSSSSLNKINSSKMSISRPFKPVKLAKDRNKKKQAGITAFFSSSKNEKAKEEEEIEVLNTPQKLQLCRSDSLIQKTSSQIGSFGDCENTDISWESSSINNFRNPVLSSKMKKDVEQRKLFVNLDEKDDTGADVEIVYSRSSCTGHERNERKRGHLELLNNLKFSRKMQKPSSVNVSKHQKVSNEDASGLPLSVEQNKVIKYAVQEGTSVFFTGSAGTGKSVVLRKLIQGLFQLHGPSRVGVTASTGLAACNIGGQTIHRYLSIGLGTGSAFELAKKIKRNPAILKRWKLLKVLIIDEISMVSGELFTKLDELAKLIRGNQDSFGGIQLVCTGDFFQLPPVKKDGQSKYCFQSIAWQNAIKKTVLLTQVFRQKGDAELIDMLNALRRGTLNPELTKKFRCLSREVNYEDGLEPTELFPTRDEVKRANQFRLKQISAKSMMYKAIDSTTDPFVLKMLDNLMCEKELELKEGAQVMYLKNLDDKIVNGSIGTVLYFMTAKLWDKINEIYWDKIYDGDERIVGELRLLASRVGCSEPWSENERAAFERIPSERKHKFEKLSYLASSESTLDLYPVVRFEGPYGTSVIRVTREDFHLEANKFSSKISEQDQITRSQLPLLLSWALSIHKAQGQTIGRLKIDLRKIFEKGQVYVALSRAVNKEHLQILNFDPRRITTSQEVREFYEKIELETLNG